ncbi:terpene synthase family protein [Sorangium sp. So ce887]|uniref:terpene synthase family protein n=1 Tax=Sorangium sp. So ce887 TaxID=3133324 RepID=UPI003F5D98F2
MKKKKTCFYYPFSASCHPDVEVVERRTLQWIHELQLAPDDRAISRIKGASVAALAAWLFPSADPRTLQLASDFTAALFLLDDAFDDGQLSKDTQLAERLNDKYLGELFGHVEADTGDQLMRGLLDVRDRIRRDYPHFVLNRWLMHCQHYYEAHLWEVKNRMHQRVPTVDEYLMMRRFSGAVYAYCDLLELLLDRPLPLEIVQHPLLQSVREICNDILCWTNDYFSLEKELRSGDVHNLIIVLRDTTGLTLEESISRLWCMHDDRIEEYQLIKQKLLSSSASNEIRQYLAGIDAMISGNQCWALGAARYAESRAFAPEDRTGASPVELRSGATRAEVRRGGAEPAPDASCLHAGLTESMPA